MSNIYEVFNVTNDHELSKVFDRLELSYNEMTNIDYIVETMNKENARTKILELMAGSADGNYEVCLEQFGKSFKKRVLKEESGLNLNQVMELNQLVELEYNSEINPSKIHHYYLGFPEKLFVLMF